MSSLTYNGIFLPYPQTTSFNQEVVADESNTDWMCTKFDIQAQFLINSNYLSSIAPDLFSANITNPPADIMTAIRTRLLARRKSLSFKVNGIEMIPLQAGVVGTVDAQNGPKPIKCQILQLTSETFILIYHITAHYWENVNPTKDRSPMVRENRSGSTILSNRWSEEVQIDTCMYTTRKRTGKYIIRSDNARADTPRNVTGLSVLAIPSGFQRMSSRYIIDPTGLGMSYEFVDKEVFKYPPFPAYEASGFYAETSPKGGVIRYGACRVKLKGGPTLQTGNPDTQALLVQAAVGIVSAKLAIVGAPLIVKATDANAKKIRAFPIHTFMSIDMYKNEVECEVKVMFGQPNRKVSGLAAFYRTQATFTPLSQPVTAKPIWYKDGSGCAASNVLIQAAAYYDPSFDNVRIDPDTGNLNIGVQPGQEGTR